MISPAIRRLVRDRAENRCEYCRTHQNLEPFVSYQIENIIPKQHGGQDDEDNLALACSHCNLHKGPNLTGIDPLTGDIVRLFDPRQLLWDDHFEFVSDLIAGKTPTGRATVRVLDMNADLRIDLRASATGQIRGG